MDNLTAVIEETKYYVQIDETRLIALVGVNGSDSSSVGGYPFDVTEPSVGDIWQWDGDIWGHVPGYSAAEVDALLGALAFEDIDGTLPWARLSGTPTTLTGYGITDAVSEAELAAWPGSANITTVGTLAGLNVSGAARFGPSAAVAGSLLEINVATGAAPTTPGVLRLRSTTTDLSGWGTTEPYLYVDFFSDRDVAGSRARIGVIQQFSSGTQGMLGFWVGSPSDFILAMRIARSGAGTAAVTFFAPPVFDFASASADASIIVRNTGNANDTATTASLRMRPDTRGSGTVHGGVTVEKEIGDWSVLNNRDAALVAYVIQNDVRVEAGRFQSNGQLNLQGDLARAGTRLLSTRRTGWAVATGTATRSTFDAATVTTAQLAERVKALIDDLHATAGHGLIGT